VQIEKRWNRCAECRLQWVTSCDLTRRPNSVVRSRPSLLIRPNDSVAIGMKLWVTGRCAYFVTLREAASSAALPEVIEVMRMYDAEQRRRMYGCWLSLRSCIFLRPRFCRRTVSSLPISTQEARRFFGTGDVCSQKCFPDDIVHRKMAAGSGSRLLVYQPMHGGLLGQSFRCIAIDVENTGLGPGGGQLLLGQSLCPIGPIRMKQ